MSLIDNAKKAVMDSLYKKEKSYLTSLNSQINGVQNLTANLKKTVGIAFIKDNDLKLERINQINYLVAKNANIHSVMYGHFDLTINGTVFDLDLKKLVSNVSIDTEIGVPDVATITINDIHSKFIQDDIIIKDSAVVLRMMLNDNNVDLPFVFQGYISAIDISFEDSNSPIMTLHCMDNCHLMNRDKKKRSWSNVTSAQVVQQIASEYGFSCYVEPSYPFPVQSSITQNNQTDWDFLKQLAGEELDLFACNLSTEIDGKTTIYYVIEGDIVKEGAVEVHYGYEPYDVLSFNPQINKETRTEKQKESGIKAADKKVETATVVSSDNTSDSSSDSGNGDSGSGDSGSSGGGDSSDDQSVVYSNDSKTWED